MVYDEILILENQEIEQGGPLGLDYDRTVLALRTDGQWLYCGYGGPTMRWNFKGDSGGLGGYPCPDIFEIPFTEAYKLLCASDNVDLIEKYFPVVDMNQLGA